MKYYERLVELGCFSRDDVFALVGNYNTAGTLLKNYLKKGYIRQVKRNLYVAVNLADYQPVVSKYNIATRITASAYVSHHAAFEYYGCANQVSYQVEVSSETPFATFSYGGNNFAYFASRIKEGIVTQPDGVRVTDMERTVIDGINDYEKIAGLEELLRCIEMIPALLESKLVSYLKSYGKKVLYQKTGYILQHYKNMLNLSDYFFAECAANIGKSTRYLGSSLDRDYVSQWQLVAPADLTRITNKGVEHFAEL